jgi:hypothetical protein
MDKDLAKRLARHPELAQEVAGMLDEIEGAPGLGLDGAEDLLVTRLRGMGQRALSAWAQRQPVIQPGAGWRKDVKKNFGS